MEIHEDNKFENYFQFLSARKKIEAAQEEDKVELQPGYPAMYSVYLLQDDNTPSDFIISIIRQFFNKSTSQAIKDAMQIDKEGRTLCNVYTRDAAETKVMQVLEYAQAEQKDIKCIMQKSDPDAIKKS